MILEIAQLQVKPNECTAFEAAFSEAQKIIAGMRGYIEHELQRCIEDDHRYVLLIKWQTLEDHMVGFRQSSQYQTWRAMLHHFYVPTPIVEHFSRVI